MHTAATAAKAVTVQLFLFKSNVFFTTHLVHAELLFSDFEQSFTASAAQLMVPAGKGAPTHKAVNALA